MVSFWAVAGAPQGIFLEGRRRRRKGEEGEEESKLEDHLEEEEVGDEEVAEEDLEWVKMSGNILELEQLKDSRELSASQLHLLLHPTQVRGICFTIHFVHSIVDIQCKNVLTDRMHFSNNFFETLFSPSEEIVTSLVLYHMFCIFSLLVELVKHIL